MKQYSLTPDAKKDLHEIWEYIAQQSFDDAERVRLEFDDAFLQLADFPNMGRLRREITHDLLRFWLLYHYVIVYRPDKKPIEIVRILSGFRNIVGLLPNFWASRLYVWGN